MSSRAFIVVATVLALSLSWSQSVNAPQGMDSSQVSEVLSDAKTLASSLRSDIMTLDFIALSASGSQTRAVTLNLFAVHTTALRSQSARLEEIRKYGTSSQQTAIDRMVPVMQELASSAEAAINATRSLSQLSSPEYREYFKLNADLAEELSHVISAWVDYANTRENLNRVAEKVGVPSGLF